ncbi:hypothetical protein [uncultured Mitsuokella sp.]|uniref:hypothetical protein n=1 Tax=uncultured Mitsuokella sp. TaxID=453120 RepID=UPI00259670E1|nr:hypothetical protein [uncultured Mitsuokella sp.]
MDKKEAENLWFAATVLDSRGYTADDSLIEVAKVWGGTEKDAAYLNRAALSGMIYEHLTNNNCIDQAFEESGPGQVDKILFDESLSQDQKSIQLYDCVARIYRLGYYRALSEGQWLKPIKKPSGV